MVAVGGERDTRPGLLRDTPDEETTDWRAVCGKTARAVRRAGRATALPDPYKHGATVTIKDLWYENGGAIIPH